jgi:hypothetical protein
MKRHLSFVAALGVCFFAPITVAHAQVKADSGNIAIGGSVTGSTVIIGIPQEKVDELVGTEPGTHTWYTPNAGPPGIKRGGRTR